MFIRVYGSFPVGRAVAVADAGIPLRCIPAYLLHSVSLSDDQKALARRMGELIREPRMDANKRETDEQVL